MRLRVRSMACEAEGVLSLGLRDPDGGRLPPWSPGAHVDLTVPGSPPRQFSLCGDPGDLGEYRLGVLLEDPSRGCTRYVHHSLRPGELVEVSRPRNNFPLVPSPRYLFVAGGIGITPVLPMLAAATAAGAEWELLYGGRRRPSMAFLDRLRPYGERVRIHPQDEAGLLDLDEALDRHDPAPTAVYCCGPEPLLAAIGERARARGFGPPRIERFRPVQVAAPEGGERAIEVVCGRSGVTVRVGGDSTILAALEAAGVPVPSSCREGICGTCETAVLDGIPDHRDSLLTEGEREAGETMMICCSRALSEKLVLDV
ncbi:ferredoxin [Acrocarpospora pleiomorpha]|uniref:Ferredoxin n=2 Tax=Acrocarpospora pleiomorpha TaxID=90975 RepID=A0A5M3XEB7_9ACTN|nr:ferredoxin [Acrocarpospora pleiomorpha]